MSSVFHPLGIYIGIQQSFFSFSYQKTSICKYTKSFHFKLAAVKLYIIFHILDKRKHISICIYLQSNRFNNL